MTTETKVLVGIAVVTIGIIGAGIAVLGKPVSTNISTTPAVDNSIIVKPGNNETGPKNAKVTLVEFGDYQCPACGQAYPTVKKLEEEYKGKVNFIFRNYPLPQHQNAMPAAKAAEAAGLQGKFWQMHDKLYETQADWSDSKKADEMFANYAKELGLNMERYKKDVNSDVVKKKILQDEQDGGTVNIRYTPSYFINGHIIEGAVPYDTFKSAIDELLK